MQTSKMSMVIQYECHYYVTGDLWHSRMMQYEKIIVRKMVDKPGGKTRMGQFSDKNERIQLEGIWWGKRKGKSKRLKMGTLNWV